MDSDSSCCVDGVSSLSEYRHNGCDYDIAYLAAYNLFLYSFLRKAGGAKEGKSGISQKSMKKESDRKNKAVPQKGAALRRFYLKKLLCIALVGHAFLHSPQRIHSVSLAFFTGSQFILQARAHAPQ